MAIDLSRLHASWGALVPWCPLPTASKRKMTQKTDIMAHYTKQRLGPSSTQLVMQGMYEYAQKLNAFKQAL